MMRKNDYWKQREEKWIQQNIKDDAKYHAEIARHYDDTLKNIKADINQFYINYAGKEHLTLDEARKAISEFDVKAFEKQAAEMVANKDFSDYANERLRIYNATMRINRLEYLKSQVGLELTKLNADEEATLKKYLGDKYVDEINRQSGILGMHKLDNILKSTEKVINASFHGATWSQRIWLNNDALKAKLDELLTRSMVRGINPKVLAREVYSQISDAVKSKKYVAERLMRTETARVQDQAQMDSFHKAGYEYCVWVAEPTACEQCADIASANDGIYLLTQVPGIPVHASCRCSKSASTGPKQIEEKIFAKKSEFVDSMKSIGFETVQTAGIGFDTMGKVFNTINKFYDNYPQMKGFIRQFKVSNAKQSSSVASAGLQSKDLRHGNISPTLTINASKLQNFDAVLKNAVGQGFWSEKSDYTGVMNHEIAHLINYKRNFNRFDIDVRQVNLSDQMQRQNFRNALDLFRTKAIDKEVIQEAFERASIELNEINIRKFISGYANQSYAEAFAEAMSNEDKNNVIGNLVKEITRRELGKIGTTTAKLEV